MDTLVAVLAASLPEDSAAPAAPKKAFEEAERKGSPGVPPQASDGSCKATPGLAPSAPTPQPAGAAGAAGAGRLTDRLVVSAAVAAILAIVAVQGFG
jgi:hypothetical protein